jgi:hypothetical protein
VRETLVELFELMNRTGSFAAIPAALAVFLLLPLYLSQRRDIARLRTWMEREPAHPAADLRASEARLDRTEAELERLGVEDGETAATLVKPPPVAGPSTPRSAAERVTSERPALARITMERAALEPHSRWRRFAERATQPRILVVIAAAAVLVGVTAILGSQQLLRDGGIRDEPGRAFERSAVTVSVLNGTEFGGLAGKVQSDIAANGYQVDTVGGTESGFERTVVMHRPGERRGARVVARDLGVRPADVQRMDRTTARLGGNAGVVVIVGEDRAR